MMRALSARVRTLSVDLTEIDVAVPPAGLIDEVRRHLLDGETHYTTRPGIVDLRRRIAERIEQLGGGSLDPLASVLITAGEREALFVILLGLGLRSGATVVAADQGGRHQGLMRLLGLNVIEAGDVQSQRDVVYREAPCSEGLWPSTAQVIAKDSCVEIHNLRGQLTEGPAGCGEGQGGEEIGSSLGAQTILMGNLHGLAGMSSFRIGFVAGPPATMKPIMVWKQALSICTAAPSQRAAIRSLDRWRAPGP
jgi:hypothetical protein